MKTVAWIGTGMMGVPMAAHLLNAGFSLRVYSRTKEKALPLLAKGALWCDNVANAVQDADAVITMVGTPADVEQVYAQILAFAAPGAYLIDMTTSSPALAAQIFKQAGQRGLHALDAPVTGGTAGAQQGSLAILVGGSRADFDACAPLFAPLGQATYFGAAGAGQHAKAANQVMIAGILSGLCEGLAYAQTNGIDLEQLTATLSRGAAQSRQLETLSPKIIHGDYSASFYTKHFVKDLRIALENACGLNLSTTESVAEHLSAMEYAQELGTQALYKHYVPEESHE